MNDYWNLQTLWFALIAVLWVGYFFLEGFDFGTGVLLPVLGRDDIDRRVLLNTIGPVWDGNEVWLLVAGGATFAAFPEWYATLFSGFYLPLFLILVALILRGVAFEFRGKHDDATWRAWWDRAIFWGSLVPALLWGVALANIVHGVPIDSSGEYAGSFWTLLNPYALVGGLTSLALFTLHGAAFLTLKTRGEIRTRARAVARRIALPTAGLVLAFLAWTYLNAVDHDHKGMVPGILPVAAILLAFAVEWLVHERFDGWAFVATGLVIVAIVATLFLNLYPRVMPSTLNAAWSLTIDNAKSTDYTLRVMSVVALLFTPIVLAYQAWSYWVFRKRIGRGDFGGVAEEAEDVTAGAAG